MPPIALIGLLSLKRKGAPDVITLKAALPPGCQKFTSSRFCWAKKLYQLLSVTPK